MNSIKSDIENGNIKNIYLLIGVEPYLINQARDMLLRALVSPDDNMNIKKYSGEKPDIDELISFADTMPFFANHRVIVIEDSRVFKNSNEKLADYLRGAPDTTYFIFTEAYTGDRQEEKKYEKSLVDKRQKMYKTVHDLGRVVEFLRMPDDILKKWIGREFGKANIKVSYRAVDLMLSLIGNDMSSLANETEKVICYCADTGVADIEEVKAICSVNVNNDIFEMVSAIASKNKRKALELYYDLLHLRESPMKIMRLMLREFNLLLLVKQLRADGATNDDIKVAAGINPYFVGRYISISNRFTYEYLKNAVSECIDTEVLFKQGRLNDEIGVEMLIIKYSS